MKPWIMFSQRLPTPMDADERGMIELLENNQREREGLWNWTHSAKSWHANGFAAWRSLHPASTRNASD